MAPLRHPDVLVRGAYILVRGGHWKESERLPLLVGDWMSKAPSTRIYQLILGKQGETKKASQKERKKD